ncbi:MAG: cytidylate kinase-like family protein [Oscillospiraceae bacterium]|jgi:cytidylate kinase|nr:cytidylate kinase-like family protein [Oscillospiraceae bacterium]
MSYSVIALSREFGSGGRIIGKELADRLGFRYYDRAIIQMAAEKSGLSPEYIERSEDDKPSFFSNLANLSTSAYVNSGMNLQYSLPVNDRAYLAQSEVIREVARFGDCVIVGRCAGYILKGDPRLLRALVYGDKEDRLSRIISVYGYEAAKAEAELSKIDKGRSYYHKFYTGIPRFDLSQYDVCINTSATDIDGAVDVLETIIKN